MGEKAKRKPIVTPITGGGKNGFKNAILSCRVDCPSFSFCTFTVSPKRTFLPKDQNSGDQPTKYMLTIDDALGKIWLLRNKASTNINGKTPALPNAQQTLIALPWTVSSSKPNNGSIKCLEMVYNSSTCVTAIKGIEMELILKPYLCIVFIMDVPRNMGNRMVKHVLLRLCTIKLSRYPCWTHADPIHPAVKSSATACPAASKAFAFFDDASAMSGMMLLLINMYAIF
mmetsp:Transcript_12693/g.23791  ORF Transcript_12693/g.23791 Transcript_12693/m.23791 type:complete len:228 (-) Transcript_12693:221-904(-)